MAKRFIEAALENLTADDLNRFKRKLNEAKPEPGYKRIPMGRLERANPVDIADTIVSFYREEYGLRVTAWALEAIGQKDEAKQLQKAADMPFVDRHEEDIIAWTPDVESLLNALKGPAQLTEDHIKAILEKETSQDQMRELYKHVSGWDDAKKGKLLEALKETNGRLIRDLGGQ